MAKVLIKINVAYPSEFIKTFDGQTDIRRKNGEQKYSSGVDEDNNNFVYVISDWDSVHAARRFWSSSDAKNQTKSWEAVGSPEITILRETPQD